MKNVILFSLVFGLFSKGNAQTPTASANYVMTQVPSDTMSTIAGDYTKLRTSISYVDGLGRPLQQVLYKAGGAVLNDIVKSHQTFDLFGRTDKTFTDYGNAGNGALSPIPLSIFGDTDAYTNIAEYDNSPLNRPTKSYGVGQAWRTSNKFSQMSYSSNGADIRIFNIQSNGTISATNFYIANSLYSKILTSERGFSTTEYSDKLGRTVAKVQQIDASTYLTTAYVYDDFGRLAYVIPPKAYNKFGTNSGQVTSFNEADNLFLEGIYAYHFDNRGRQIEKHIPGAGWTRFVYDKNDHLVMENDDKDVADNFWKFTKYDAVGRPIMSGIRSGIGATARQTLQDAFDSHTGNTFETTGTTLLGYTNVSFPAGYEISDANVKTVTYYDNYTWLTESNYNFNSANAFDNTQGSAIGLMTGALIRNCETDAWYKSVQYYDYKARNIQTFNQNHLGSLNRSDYQYSFTDEVLKMRLVHQSITELYAYTYDHIGRKTSFRHTKNGFSQNIAKYTQDEIGRLKTKTLSPAGSNVGTFSSGDWVNNSSWNGGNQPTIKDVATINTGHNITINNGETVGAGQLILSPNSNVTNNGTINLGNLTQAPNPNSLQNIDYKYHIRGGLKGINLDASGNLTNSIFSYKLGYEADGNYFDGNIRSQEWKSSIDGLTRSFTYSYDGGSRILSGAYVGNGTEKYSLNSVTLDENGGITSLSRDGLKSNNSFGLVDELAYTYFDNSNKIKKVDDNSNETASFTDVTGDDYTYYPDGSLKSDANKGISLIEYNFLKLPRRIVKGSIVILNEYDATGKKLKETIGSNITDYETNLIYKNNALTQLSHDEGRIVDDIYEYYIKDHLGNLRVAFKDSAGVAKITQSNAYGVWGENLPTLAYKNTPNSDQFKYTGKEESAETGYIDFGARLFDNLVPRFITVDKMSEQTMSISTFAYANNDPINMKDIGGLFAVSVHYQITYDALRALGYTHKRADLIAHYSSTYADHPPKLASFLDFTLHPFETKTHSYREGINYSVTRNSQDENYSHWHSMMSDAEAEAGMTEEQAMNRGLQTGWDFIFDSKNGTDIGKLGQGLHALQDAVAHKGAKTSDHLGWNLSSMGKFYNDMYGDRKLAGNLTSSALQVINLLQNKKVNLKDGDTLNLTGMSKNQFMTIMQKLFNQGFQGTIINGD